MPAKPLSDEQKGDAARLKQAFLRWQDHRKVRKEPATQDAFAGLVGFGQSALNQYLNAKIPLNADALAKLCEHLGVSPNEISPSISEAERSRSSQWSLTASPSASRTKAPNEYVVTEYPLRGDDNTAETPRAGEPSLIYAGTPQYKGMVPVVAVARTEQDGFFDEQVFQQQEGGVVPSIGTGSRYALRIKGDGFSPVYEHDTFVVVSRDTPPQNGSKVLITFKNKSKAIRKLLFQRSDSISVTLLTGGQQHTIEVEEIQSLHSIVGSVELSEWVAESPN